MTCLNNSFFITRREFPHDEDTISSAFLIKSGMIVKNENGVYTYMPMGLKVLNNVSNIIKEEFNRINAMEVLMPSLVNSDIFYNSKRGKIFDSELFNVNDKNNNSLCLCPTHEELFAYLARYRIQSYKDLHFSLFQISNKYRDEDRLEYGLIRKKEFFMADAYSFDSNDGGLDVSYDKMFQAFKRTFNRMGINTVVVDASADDMKGLSSEEFQVINPHGDNEVVKCTNCSFTMNREDVICKSSHDIESNNLKKLEMVKTPKVKTIKEVSEYLSVSDNKVIKSLVVKIDEEYTMILLRGESKLNITKLYKLFNTKNISIPSENELEKIGTYVGFVGPVKSTMKIIADSDVKNMINAICGANKKGYHYINVNPGRDFRVNKYADIKLFDENCVCPKCKNKCEILRGIEVGHIFKLGDAYSEEYNLKYSDESNEINYVHMGSYGIGIDRCIAAIVEENHDSKGIIWPVSVAPYKVGIVVANVNDRDAYHYAVSLHDKLNELGIDTLLDDRKESIGVKFNDMDLIGVPIRVTVGIRYKDNKLELKLRNEDKLSFINVSDIISVIDDIIKEKTTINY